MLAELDRRSVRGVCARVEVEAVVPHRAMLDRGLPPAQSRFSFSAQQKMSVRLGK